MILCAATTNHVRPRRRGLSLVEMIISIPLIGIALVVAFDTVGASKASQFKVKTSIQGCLLAQELMSEILMQDFADREGELSSFAADGTEGLSGNRSLFDDVDDYDQWTSGPPQDKDGTVKTHLTGWERQVNVSWLRADNLNKTPSVSAIKEIKVTTKLNGAKVCVITALRTSGLPPSEACCFSDGTCEDLRVEECTSAGGASSGPETKCATMTCPTGPTVLFAVTDIAALTSDELLRKTLIESWDFRVNLIASSAWQEDFDNAADECDVAFVSALVSATELGTKLQSTSIGVVNACTLLIGDFGFASGTLFYVNLSTGVIQNNSHYITDSLPLDTITLATTSQWFAMVQNGLASGADTLLTVSSNNDAIRI